jgi:hypothetical protein
VFRDPSAWTSLGLVLCAVWLILRTFT